jgi:hypothetical protein
MLRRVCRHLFTLCAAASLVLCVALVVLWARSYRRTDVAFFNHGSGGFGAATLSGGSVVWVNGNNYYADVKDDPGWHAGSWRYASAYGNLSPIERGPRDGDLIAGFGYQHSFRELDGVRYQHQVWFPLWLPATLTAVVATIELKRLAPLVKHLAKRRPCAPGICPQCGYDLRASPGRCPECGTLPK